MPRRHAPNAAEERARRRHVAKSQIRGDRILVEATRHARVRQNGLDLASEDEQAVRAPVIEGLLAETIPPEDEPFPTLVPHGEREHSIQCLRELYGFAILGEVSDDLGIALGRQAVPGPLEIGPQRPEVVDLAVERDADATILVTDRWISGDEVDDGQAVLGDHRALGGEHTLRVGSTVLEAAELVPDSAFRDARGVSRDRARDPAHCPWWSSRLVSVGSRPSRAARGLID